MSPFRLLARAAATSASLFLAASALAQTAICYNCPTEWADWGTQLPGFLVHAWSQTGRLTSHVVFCGPSDGPFPFHDGASLID